MVMAGAATTIIAPSPFITAYPFSPFTQHCGALHFSPLHQPPHHHHVYPRLITSRAKLRGAYEGEANDISEAFSDVDELLEYESDEEEEEDDDTESSVDLFLRFLGSMFRKVSKRARKASRSLLPDIISPQLVSFAVDGVLLLALLSILKALLEVLCTLGGTVFVVILMLRVIWSAVSYFQSNDNGFNQSGSSYGKTQPVS